MLVLHMPPPVILPRERLAALPGVRAVLLRAVVLPRLVVLVIDVAIQVGLGAEPHVAAWMEALMRSLMVPFVVAIAFRS